MSDKIAEREQLSAQLTEGGVTGPLATQIRKQITEIDQFVGNKAEAVGDPLEELWEMQLDAGLEPNLDLTLEDLKNGQY